MVLLFRLLSLQDRETLGKKLLGIILHLCEKIVKAWLNTK